MIGATYVRDVEPGEMLRITRAGIESLHFAAEKPLQHCIFEHVYFARPDSLVFGRVVEQSREMLGRLLAREHPRSGRHRRAGARFGRAGGDRLLAGIRRAVPHGLDPQSLRRAARSSSRSRPSAISA